jgi:hypothetical protein
VDLTTEVIPEPEILPAALGLGLPAVGLKMRNP